MTYEPIPGLIFTFTTSSSGLVTDITTPDIPFGLGVITAYTLHLDTAMAVSGAQALVLGILAMLGIHP